MKYDLILIDGHSLVYRAFFALPPLSLPDGTHTGAVYGFLRMLFRLLSERDPGSLIVAFDVGLPTARLELYPEYKAHRPDMPDDLRSQFPLVREALSVLSIPICEAEGFEADDVIGTLAARAEARGLNTLIVTGDRDVLQLVTDQTHALVTKKGITETELYDVDAVRKRYNLDPPMLLDVKALMGDSSDNIPGIPGVGEKTAIKLVSQYGSLDEILSRADDIGGRPGRLVREHADSAILSRQLAAIDREAPVALDPNEAKPGPIDQEQVRTFLTRLGFRSLLSDVPGLDQAPAQVGLFADAEDDSVRLEGLVDDARAKISRGGTVALVFAGSVADVGAVLGIACDGHSWWWADDIDRLPELVTGLLPGWVNEPPLAVLGHDTKSLITELVRRGLDVRGPEFDSEVAWYLVDPARSSYPVTELAAAYLDAMVPDARIKRGKRDPAITPDQAGPALAAQAAALLQLQEPLSRELTDRGLTNLYRDVELPLIPILAEMQARGILIDRQALDELDREFVRRLAEVEEDIYRVAEWRFNINSPRQVGELLFERLGLPAARKTATGYSTDAEVLQGLADWHEAPRLILEHRQLAKLKSTYVDGLADQIDAVTGRVHTRFNQTVTATGRLSSSEPNLQNIPIRMDVGRKIRRVFIPDGRDMVLVAADYSQIELRVLAHLSEDEGLCQSFRNDEDIHTRTASEVFGVDLDAVTPEMRNRAKAVNFGIVYGITDFGLSRDLGVDQSEAREYIEGYFERYPGVRRYLDEQIDLARSRGYVTTVLGRRRYLPEIESRNAARRKFAERMALNTPVQGSAADIIKLAMIRVAGQLNQSGLRADLLLQVHDELVLEVAEADVRATAELLRREMEAAYSLLVPLRVDVKAGRDWEAMSPVVIDDA